MADNVSTDASRRRFLVASASLTMAGSLGMVSPALANSWNFEQWHPQPENTKWRILDAHDTGYVTPDSNWKRKNCGHLGRLQFDPPNDGRPSFCHVVEKGGIVHPLGIDSQKVPADFSNFSRVLLRYHQWIDEHSNIEGKWIGLQLGRGWVARAHPKDANALYGQDGCSATTMHPARSAGNSIRLLASHHGQKSPYGLLVGRGSEVLRKGRWLTIDVIIERDVGYRLYVDGVQQAKSGIIVPVANWNSCRAIWYRTRLMHGGTPANLPAINAYKEWFGGFYIAVA